MSNIIVPINTNWDEDPIVLGVQTHGKRQGRMPVLEVTNCLPSPFNHVKDLIFDDILHTLMCVSNCAWTTYAPDPTSIEANGSLSTDFSGHWDLNIHTTPVS